MAYDVCMVVHNDILNDSRIWREARALNSQGWKVVVVCISLGNSELPEVQTVDSFTIWRVIPTIFRRRSNLKTIGKLIQLTLSLPKTCTLLRRSQAKIYHGHDFPGLLIIALAGIWRKPVVYDSHEVFFDRGFRNMPVPRWAIRLLKTLRHLEKALAHRAVAIIATSDGHADQIAKNLNIKKPIVVRNAVDLRTLKDQVVEYPRNNRRLVVHSGGLLDGRHLFELIQALSYLPDDIALILMGNGPLKTSLEKFARDIGVAHKLEFVSAVPPDSVPLTLAQGDIGAVLITGDSVSYQYSLPNKFFESLAAGLPLVVSGIPELARMVKEYDIGLICDPTQPEDIAAKIEELLRSDNLERFRHNVEQARAQLNWQNEESKLISIYNDIL
jgi:glycosyltransferase involved in cell wall biosynthesis